MKASFTDQVRDAIEDHAMISKGDKVLVGLSGGPDSIALVRVLLYLKEELDFDLGTAHLNHSLRGEESLRDEGFVREFARSRGLDLALETRDIKTVAKENKLSLEEAGRNARYDFFHRTAKACGYTRIATGHNRDDHVEQVLMNLIRGTGPSGLKGIRPVRDNRFIRPLIHLSKTEILAFLELKHQPFVLDASNSDPAFLRNRIRHRLIPMLETEFNPHIKSGVNRLSKILAIEDDYMEKETEKAFEKALLKEDPHSLSLSSASLSGLHPALAARVLRRGIAGIKQDLKRITHTHIMESLCLARQENSGKSLDLPGQIRVYKKQGSLCIQKERLPLRELGRRQKAGLRKSRENRGGKT